MATGKTGNTASVTFGTSGFTANIRSITGTSRTRPSINDSHLGTSTHETYCEGDLVEPGEFAMTIEWDQSFSTFPPITAVAETVTITYPLKSGEGTAATLAGTAFLTGEKGPDLNNNQLNEGELTVKWDGKTGPTYTAGSV